MKISILIPDTTTENGKYVQTTTAKQKCKKPELEILPLHLKRTVNPIVVSALSIVSSY